MLRLKLCQHPPWCPVKTTQVQTFRKYPKAVNCITVKPVPELSRALAGRSSPLLDLRLSDAAPYRVREMRQIEADCPRFAKGAVAAVNGTRRQGDLLEFRFVAIPACHRQILGGKGDGFTVDVESRVPVVAIERIALGDAELRKRISGAAFGHGRHLLAKAQE